MAVVRVSFEYQPQDPDEGDSTGLSEQEFEELTDRLMMDFGAENIEVVPKEGWVG